jgi:probable rRNA maturation factor
MLVRVTSDRDPEPLALETFERLGAFALRLEDAPDQAELSVAIVSAEEMAHLNEKCDDPCPAGSGEPITLGDVIIAPEIAEAQAADLGTTVEAELNLLLVHGILHLLGYEHDADDAAEAMQAREGAILQAWADQS